MTARGRSTREKLLAATTQVVKEVGYSRATTKAIAQAAGVAEGTIYRHFPDKASLFFAAGLHKNAAVVEHLSSLPERAGHGTVEANLVEVLTRLATLRDEILPLEIALLTDPELAAYRGGVESPVVPGAPPPPPVTLAAYLTAEQRLGRLPSRVPCDQAAQILLATLFGLAVRSPAPGGGVDEALLRAAVRMYLGEQQ